MEFTYDGMVRHAFGFQNPNHAAALFALLSPWAWAGVVAARRWPLRRLCGFVAAALIVALTLTYSRAGMVVLLAEAGLFGWWTWRSIGIRANPMPLEYSPQADSTPEPREEPRYHETRRIRQRVVLGFAAVMTVFLVAAVASGAAGRMVGWIAKPDKAVTNRFAIWRGGLELFAANPGGVGLGHSGLLYTAFIAPEDAGIEVRTLVNAFLTPLTEFGAGWGVAGAAVLFFALAAGWRGRKRSVWSRAALTALIGLMLSGGLSTCVDLAALADPEFVGWTPLNRGMGGLLVTAALATAALLVVTGIRMARRGRMVLVSGAAALLAIGLAFAAGRVLDSGRSPVVVGEDGERLALLPPAGTPPEGGRIPDGLMLYDDRLPLAGAVRWLRRWSPEARMRLPLVPWHRHAEPPAGQGGMDEVILQGVCAHFAERFPNAAVTLVSPPEGIPRTGNVTRLFLRRYSERSPWGKVEDLGFSILFY